MRHRSLDEMEQRAEVDREGAVPLLVRDLLERLVSHLERRVADEDVHPAELLDGLRDHGPAVGGVREVAGDQDGLLAGLLDPRRGVLRVLVLVEVGDEDVGALPGVRDRDGLADAAVGAGDDGGLAGEPAGAAIALLAVIGLGGQLRLGAGRGLLLRGLCHGNLRGTRTCVWRVSTSARLERRAWPLGYPLPAARTPRPGVTCLAGKVP